MAINIGEMCTHCGRDTSAGSGLYVNRIPSSGDWTVLVGDENFEVNVDGYMCIDCQCVPCEVCGELTMEWDTFHYQGTHVWACPECVDTKNLIPVQYPTRKEA